MGTVIPFEDPSDYARIHRRIKRLWDEGSFTFPDVHVEQRMKKREMDVLDIQHIVRYGSIISHDRRGAQWRYRIQGSRVDGKTASCVVAVEGGVLIISVLDY